MRACDSQFGFDQNRRHGHQRPTRLRATHAPSAPSGLELHDPPDDARNCSNSYFLTTRGRVCTSRELTIWSGILCLGFVVRASWRAATAAGRVNLQ